MHEKRIKSAKKIRHPLQFLPANAIAGLHVFRVVIVVVVVVVVVVVGIFRLTMLKNRRRRCRRQAE